MMFLYDFFAWLPLVPRLIVYGLLVIFSILLVVSIIRKVLDIIPFA